METPTTKDGTSYNKEFIDTRPEIKKRDGYHCRMCGGERKSLHVHKGRGKYRKIKLGCASYRRRYTKQRSGKPSNTVYELPYRLTQNEKIIFVGHEYQKGYVYDLQVANDHNFFANGFLVHNCMIIDDLIKNVEEAYSENTLEKHWLWFTDTMLSRLEEGGKIIIIMTPLGNW